MSLKLYDAMREKYETTKPIRGRSVDIRPWGDRRRDEECIVRFTRVLDGEIMYGAKLYDTVVFAVDPKGSVAFRCNGWVTPSTVQFMNLVMKDLSEITGKMFGNALRRFKGIWVRAQPVWDAEAVHHLVPRNDPLIFNYHLDTDSYTAPLTTITKKTINRKRIKEVRKKIKPFRDYCMSLLKLSNGFVSGELYKEYGLADKNPFGGPELKASGIRFSLSSGEVRDLLIRSYGCSSDLLELAAYEFMMEQDEAVFLPLLLLLSRMAPAKSASINQTYVDDEGRDVQTMSLWVDPQDVDTLIDNIIKNRDKSVWDYKEVCVTEPTKSDD